MNTIEYLTEIYGYQNPIILKNLRIGGKSKTAIRKELSRAVDQGKLVRRSQGVYCLKADEPLLGCVTFEKIVEQKYVKDSFWSTPNIDLDVYGYYTGETFLNQIGVSQQVPAVLDIVTNNTSCKRKFYIGRRTAILRKPKTTINCKNYIALQFFDAMNYMSDDDIKDNYKLLYQYIKENITKEDFSLYIGLYPTKVMKRIVEEGFIRAFR